MFEQHYDIAHQMFRYLRNELSSEEELIFLHELKKHPEYMKVLESFRNGKQVQSELDFLHNLDVDSAWEKVNPNPVSHTRAKGAKWWAIAASIIFLGLCSFWIWRYQQPDMGLRQLAAAQHILPATDKAELILSDGRAVALHKNASALLEADGTAIFQKEGMLSYQSTQQDHHTRLIYNTLRVPRSGTFRLVLPDGTAVWINANSELRYPVHFAKNERKIYLKGEAYFEVSRDVDRPFKVEVEGTEVEVLGTHFNVRAYGDRVSTTLLEGAVKVQYAQQSVLLEPGQQARSFEDNIEVQQADLTKAVAWKDDIFYFNEDRLVDIMEEISRWYDVEIAYDGKVSDQRYTGSIRRDARLSEVLELIGFTSAVEFKVSGRRVTMKF